MSNMFFYCKSLTTGPLINTANVTNMFFMFYGCSSLTTVPLYNTANATNMGYMFNNCPALTTIPALDMNLVTSISGMFGICPSLSRIEAAPKISFTITNCKLSAAELDALYTRLPTVTSRTITVTGNYGVASDDPTIATAKGWTVTG
jgi:surface protein